MIEVFKRLSDIHGITHRWLHSFLHNW